MSQPSKTCVACGASATSGCKNCGALYCSRKCQVGHWAVHKKVCGKSQASTKKCARCDRPAERACSRCLKTHYCSRECQVTHWPSHRAHCARKQAKPSQTSHDEDVGRSVAQMYLGDDGQIKAAPAPRVPMWMTGSKTKKPFQKPVVVACGQFSGLPFYRSEALNPFKGPLGTVRLSIAGSRIRFMEMQGEDPIVAVAEAGNEDTKIQIVNLMKKTMLLELRGYKGPIFGLMPIVKTDFLASGDYSGHCYLDNWKTGERAVTFKNVPYFTGCITYDPFTTRLFIAGDISFSPPVSVREYDVKSPSMVQSYGGLFRDIHGVSCLKDLNAVSACGNDNTVRIWDRKSLKLVSTGQCPPGPNAIRDVPGDIYYAPDLHCILVGLSPGRVLTFDPRMMSRGPSRGPFRVHSTGHVHCISRISRTKFATAGEVSQSVFVWKYDGKGILSTRTPGNTLGVCCVGGFGDVEDSPCLVLPEAEKRVDAEEEKRVAFVLRKEGAKEHVGMYGKKMQLRISSSRGSSSEGEGGTEGDVVVVSGFASFIQVGGCW